MPSAGVIKNVEGLNPYQKLLLAICGPKPKPKAKPKTKKIINTYTTELHDVPKLGDIAWASDIGRKGNARYKFIACPVCHKERWVNIYDLEYSKYKGRCISCWDQRSRLNGNGKIHTGGYIHVKLQPDDFFYPMADKQGYVAEHRLVMARHLGRCLNSCEIVRYNEGVRKDDNRIEVLQLMTNERNIQIMVMERKKKRLEERITLLEGENVLLGAQLNQVTEGNNQAAG